MDSYKAETNVKRLPEKEKKASLQNPLEDFISPSTVQDFDKTERLSKRLSRMGVASRRMAEKLISQGMVYVDGKPVSHNVPVNNESKIKVSAKSGMYTPVKEQSRIWLFHKPR